MTTRNKIGLLVAGALFAGVVGWMLLNPPAAQPARQPAAAIAVRHPNGEAFAGSASCQNCHAALYQSHQHTAHFLTSQPASELAIGGSFAPGQNTFAYGPTAQVAAERRPAGLFQVGYVAGQEAMAQRFDVVVGSGRKGQTYLFWHHDRLFQLPVSYYAPTKSWSNSPGYPADQILFNRPISGRCLECHATYASKTSLDPAPETYDRGQLLLGIGCERCHGPSARHVAFHTEHPEANKARYVVNAATLTRQQRLDACALCHAGLGQALKPAFAFVTGDRLSDYSRPDYHADSLVNLDVHGNQYGLLMASQCFQNSPAMDCSSCHNVHANERNSLALFSQRCTTCHTAEKDCKLASAIGPKIRQNCIDCHMPATPSRQLTLQVEGQQAAIPNLVRTHRVGIYKPARRDLLPYLRNLPATDAF